MEVFVHAVASELRSLANEVENNSPNDYLQFRLDGLMEDLLQINAQMGNEVGVDVLDRLQEVAHQLTFCLRQRWRKLLDVPCTFYLQKSLNFTFFWDTRLEIQHVYSECAKEQSVGGCHSMG